MDVFVELDDRPVGAFHRDFIVGKAVYGITTTSNPAKCPPMDSKAKTRKLNS